MKTTNLIASTILAIVISSISIHASAQHSDSIPRIKSAYNAILSEGGAVDNIYNPIFIVDTLAYLEKVLEVISSTNELFQQFKPIWDGVGIMIYDAQGDIDVMIKETQNGLFISFFDPTERYRRMRTEKDVFLSSFYPELGIIEVPNPRSFRSLDVFAMLLAHETTHVVTNVPEQSDELTPYIIETMVLIQYKWGKQVLNQVIDLYKQEKSMTYPFVSGVQNLVPQTLSKIENAALVPYLLLAGPMMVEQPQTYTGFMSIIHAYNVYMAKAGFKEYKVDPL